MKIEFRRTGEQGGPKEKSAVCLSSISHNNNFYFGNAVNFPSSAGISDRPFVSFDFFFQTGMKHLKIKRQHSHYFLTIVISCEEIGPSQYNKCIIKDHYFVIYNILCQNIVILYEYQ